MICFQEMTFSLKLVYQFKCSCKISGSTVINAHHPNNSLADFSGGLFPFSQEGGLHGWAELGPFTSPPTACWRSRGKGGGSLAERRRTGSVPRWLASRHTFAAVAGHARVVPRQGARGGEVGPLCGTPDGTQNCPPPPCGPHIPTHGVGHRHPVGRKVSPANPSFPQGIYTWRDGEGTLPTSQRHTAAAAGRQATAGGAGATAGRMTDGFK